MHPRTHPSTDPGDQPHRHRRQQNHHHVLSSHHIDPDRNYWRNQQKTPADGRGICNPSRDSSVTYDSTHHSSGAKGIRTPDLLDANESTWAFVAVDFVGRRGKRQVNRLEAFTSEERRRSYCGRIADARPIQLHGEKALAVQGEGDHRRGAPPPFRHRRTTVAIVRTAQSRAECNPNPIWEVPD
jgi:hypothetical protein